MATTLTTADLVNYNHLVVTDYYANGGTTGPKVGEPGVDSTLGLQKAIYDAFYGEKVLYFPLGTYLVSDTLRFYKWNWGGIVTTAFNHKVFGQTGAAGERPIIKLNTTQTQLSGTDTRFNQGRQAGDTTSTPRQRPIVHLQNFGPTDLNFRWSAPADWTTWHPYNLPPPHPEGNWVVRANTNFDIVFHNIDLDTSGYAYADGMWFGAAQLCTTSNVKITATGSQGYGLVGGNGRGGCVMNVEVIGGAISVRTDSFPATGGHQAQGVVYAGLTCTNPTTKFLELHDSTPPCFVGFNFTGNGVPVFVAEDPVSTADQTACFIDGKITDTSGLNPYMFDNTTERSLYIRNVYITGTPNLVRTGSGGTVNLTQEASGTWKVIQELSRVNQGGGTSLDSTNLVHKWSVAGSAWATTRDAVTTKTNTETPPADFVARHIAEFPTIDQGPMIIVGEGDYASPVDPDDWSTVINTAIIDAQTEGHNRVFLSPRNYFVKNTIHMLKNTRLFGVQTRYQRLINGSTMDTQFKSTIILLPMNTIKDMDWFFIDTEDADGTAALAWVAFTHHTDINAGNDAGLYPSDPYTGYPSFIHWRTGPWSVITGIWAKPAWQPDPDFTRDHIALKMSGHAGGKIYTFEGAPGVGFGGSLTRAIYVENTNNSSAHPISFYGPQPMGSKTALGWRANFEFKNSNNIRHYGGMREGGSTATLIIDSKNIGMFSQGAWREGVRADSGSSVKIQETGAGLTDNITIANWVSQRTNQIRGDMITDSTASGSPVLAFPNGIALYKKGTLNDAAMIPAPITPAVTFDNPLASPSTTFYPGNTIEVTASPAFKNPITKITFQGGNTLTPTTTGLADATFVIPGLPRFVQNRNMNKTRMGQSLTCTIHAGTGAAEETATATLTIAAPLTGNYKLTTLVTAYSGWAAPDKVWTNASPYSVDDAAVGDDILIWDKNGTNKLTSISTAGDITVTSTPVTLEARVFDVSTGLWGYPETIIYDTPVTNLPDPNNPPDGKIVVELTSVNGVDLDSIFSPPLDVGDYLIVDDVTRSGYALTVNPDGSYSVAEGIEVTDNSVNTRERFTVQGYYTATDTYTIEKYEYFRTNNGSTFFTIQGVTQANDDSIIYLDLEDGQALSLDISDYITDQYGDPLTYDLDTGELANYNFSLVGSVLSGTIGPSDTAQYIYDMHFVVTDVLGYKAGFYTPVETIEYPYFRVRIGPRLGTELSDPQKNLVLNREVLINVDDTIIGEGTFSVSGLPTGLTLRTDYTPERPFGVTYTPTDHIRGTWITGTPTVQGTSAVTLTKTATVSDYDYVFNFNVLDTAAEFSAANPAIVYTTVGAGPYAGNSLVLNHAPNLSVGDLIIYQPAKAELRTINTDPQSPLYGQEVLTVITQVFTVQTNGTYSITDWNGATANQFQFKYQVRKVSDGSISTEYIEYVDAADYPPIPLVGAFVYPTGTEDVNIDMNGFFFDPSYDQPMSTFVEVGSTLSTLGLVLTDGIITGKITANVGVYTVTITGTNVAGQSTNNDLLFTITEGTDGGTGTNIQGVFTIGDWFGVVVGINQPNDAMMLYFQRAGLEGNLNDRLKAWLQGLPAEYQGALSDMLAQWIRDNLSPHV